MYNIFGTAWLFWRSIEGHGGAQIQATCMIPTHHTLASCSSSLTSSLAYVPPRSCSSRQSTKLRNVDCNIILIICQIRRDYAVRCTQYDKRLPICLRNISIAIGSVFRMRHSKVVHFSGDFCSQRRGAIYMVGQYL